MRETVMILHGWPQPITSHWYSWLKTELEEKDYTVYLPELPTMLTRHPIMGKQLSFVENLIHLDDTVSIIGHSLGAVLALRLAERNKLKRIILVGGFDYDDLTEELTNFWPNKIDHSKIIENTLERIVIHSDNDPYTLTKMNAEAMAKRLKAQFILVPGAGHFMEEDSWTTIEPALQLF